MFMRSGAVFSLAHVEDAQPQSGKGICLGEPQQAWLNEFRGAIANCVKEAKKSTDGSSKPVFKVRGYASVAPMHVGGNTSESARLNCKVANWRAAAVGAFLAKSGAEKDEKRWRCESVADAFNKVPPNELNECGEPYEGPEEQPSSPFRVDVHQWATSGEMLTGKPADDGTVPGDRRFDVEILNRVVHIDVPKDFCRTAASQAGSP